ncbi:hypothetical protein ACC720_32435 [Rhizobium ruizarguesonis]
MTPVVAQALGLAIFTDLRGMEFDMAAMLNLSGEPSGNHPRTKLDAPSPVPEPITGHSRLEEIDL